MTFSTPLSAVRADLLAKLSEADMREAAEAVLTPTPLDILCLAELRHTAPDLADKIADEEGRRFDRENKRTMP